MLDSDEHGLTVHFVGGSEDRFRYDAELVETAAAITVIPIERPVQEFPAGTIFTAEGYDRQVRIQLDEPLGGRVLVNLDGTPVEVIPA